MHNDNIYKILFASFDRLVVGILIACLRERKRENTHGNYNRIRQLFSSVNIRNCQFSVKIVKEYIENYFILITVISSNNVTHADTHVCGFAIN